MADWIEEGKKAPTFTLVADGGQKVGLKDFLGQPLVIFFYPKDDTPACTQEACQFRDIHKQLSQAGAAIVGISCDSQESHEQFKQKFKLNFPLLVDANHKVAEKYGAWREKNMYGKLSWGVQRSTFLVDAQGKVVKIWKRVIVEGHQQQVLDELAKLSDN